MEDSLDAKPPAGPPPTRVSRNDRPDLPRDLANLPDLPAAYRHALDEGLASLRLDLPAPARTAIDGHVRMLLAWNEAINLTAIAEPEAIATRHVIDSLTAVSPLAGASAILDLGSGGGFPGLPLAAALPAARLTLVDSIGKKAAFLEAVVVATGLAGRVTVRAARVEALAGSAWWDAVVARGIGSLAELVELGLPLLRQGGRLLAWKRGDLADELDVAARAAAALGGAAPVTRVAVPGGRLPGLEGHVLVEVTKVRATPPGYPRDPAARRRREW